MSHDNYGRPLPWQNVPRCREITPRGRCNGPMVPVRAMANGFGGPRDSRIACSACGEGIRGTNEEVRRCDRADRAHMLLLEAKVHEDRGCARCNGPLLRDRERLCAPCVEADNAERQGVLL